VLEFLDGRFQFLAINAAGGNAVKPYPLVEDLVRPVLRVGRREEQPYVRGPKSEVKGSGPVPGTDEGGSQA